MNRHGLLTTAFLAVTLLLSCAAAAGAQGAGAPAQASKALPAAQVQGGGRVFRGWVGKYPVRMTLRRGEGGELSGSYSYVGRGGELALKGTVEAGGDFTLDEFDGAKKTGTFKGRLREKDYEPRASIEGEWTRPGGGGEQSFSLSEELVGGADLTEKRIKETDKARRYEIDASYPQVGGALTFNRMVEELVRKEVNDFKRAPGARPPAGGPSNTLDINYSMRLSTGELQSALFMISRLEYGMAHSAYSFRAVNYDSKSGRQLQLADLFKPGSNYLERISSAAVARLRQWNREEGDAYLGDAEYLENASPKLKNYQHWTLTARGLAVTFEPYQVGPFAAGAPAVLVPYAELRDVIRPDGPLASLLK